jgi:hypothetical protein
MDFYLSFNIFFYLILKYIESTYFTILRITDIYKMEILYISLITGSSIITSFLVCYIKYKRYKKEKRMTEFYESFRSI